MSGKLPQIPSIQGLDDDALVPILQAIKDILEIRSGQRPSTDYAWAVLSELPVQTPGLRAVNSIGQSIPNVTATAVAFDETDWANGWMKIDPNHSDRLLIPKAGIYLLSGSMGWASNTTGVRFMAFGISGVQQPWTQVSAGVDGTGRISHQMLVQLKKTDYVQAYVYQSSGGALSLSSTTTGSNHMAVQFLSP